MLRTTPILLLVALPLVAASCGSDESPAEATATTVQEAPDGSGPTTTFEDVGPPPTSPDKPSVEFPGGTPTELVRTVLTEGSGPEAAAGDTVIVDYIGVRSVDGVEFDNSYDRGQPFPVNLGAGSVIQGWDDGLVGARAGDRIQLDIPSDLAYGSTARSDVIRADEPLTFVIDVRAVVKQADPADKPTEAGVDASTEAIEVTSVDLIDGDGAEVEAGQTAIIHLVLFRGDNLVALEDTWQSEPIQIVLDETGFPALVDGLVGMKVGGRRAITAPPEKAFGPEGNPPMGLPADTDVVLVVDLLGVY